MKRIYIAGPMTGIEAFNFPAFNADAARLRALGHSVINPAEVNPDTRMSWVDCMRMDIALLVTCDAISLLPGWGQQPRRHAGAAHRRTARYGCFGGCMSVYVDNMRAPYRRMVMCHMIADSEQELHDMAQRIGVARKWHQGDHYDVCLQMRAKAVALGAVELTQMELGRMVIAQRRVAA